MSLNVCDVCFNDTQTTEYYTYSHTLSLLDALAICAVDEQAGQARRVGRAVVRAEFEDRPDRGIVGAVRAAERPVVTLHRHRLEHRRAVFVERRVRRLHRGGAVDAEARSAGGDQAVGEGVVGAAADAEIGRAHV